MNKTSTLIALGIVALAIPASLWALQGHGAEHVSYARLFWILAIMLLVGKFS